MDYYLLQLSLHKYIMYETGELLEHERLRYDRVIHCRRLLSALHAHDILTLSKLVEKHGICLAAVSAVPHCPLSVPLY